MSVDDGPAFLGMTFHMPVDGQTTGASCAAEKVNFFDLAQQGIAGTARRHDGATARSLKQAIAIMQREQVSAIAIDTLV